MEIDHHDPTLTGSRRNKYENLFLAVRHCNNAKGETWPTKSARKNGIRFLNPCAEMDYGIHIVEHPITHRLVGLTPAGDFHITTCDLNARHFVDERKDRAAILDLLQARGFKLKQSPLTFPSDEIRLLHEQVSKMIPEIPYLSASHPKYQEDLDIVAALSQGAG